MFGSTCYVYYKLKKFFYLISILKYSQILYELTNLEQNVASELTKPMRGHGKKTEIKLYYRFGALLAPVSGWYNYR